MIDEPGSSEPIEESEPTDSMPQSFEPPVDVPSADVIPRQETPIEGMSLDETPVDELRAEAREAAEARLPESLAAEATENSEFDPFEFVPDIESVPDDALPPVELSQLFAATAAPNADSIETAADANCEAIGPRYANGSENRVWARWLIRLAGHLFFSLLGLAIGYYILCWINPQGNFLHLSLPGIRSAEPGSEFSH